MHPDGVLMLLFACVLHQVCHIYAERVWTQDAMFACKYCDYYYDEIRPLHGSLQADKQPFYVRRISNQLTISTTVSHI